MYYLSNTFLKIAINEIGAELCEISSVENKTQFMWNADPNIWGSFAPNLFPVIGAIKNDSYHFEGKEYSMTKHGFVRNNTAIKLTKSSKKSLTFKLETDDTLFKMYPFKFEFYITYTLKKSRLIVKHEIINKDTKSIYFSLGGHPAFKCPVFENENYNDYALDFEHSEQVKSYLINMDNGLLTNQTVDVFNNSDSIKLYHNLFDKDALVFKNIKSKKVTLNSKNHGKILTVRYKDFNDLGIWAKPNGNYVCIEPWLGFADQEDTNQELTEKEGIIALPLNEKFSASYSIQIHKRHLA